MLSINFVQTTGPTTVKISSDMGLFWPDLGGGRISAVGYCTAFCVGGSYSVKRSTNEERERGEERRSASSASGLTILSYRPKKKDSLPFTLTHSDNGLLFAALNLEHSW